jgi:DNA repair exonuclease SbcCD ATPase subunit
MIFYFILNKKIKMYIKFKNFRCYDDKTFEFDDIGMSLISAPSGQGKSTILMGINFALYGSSIKDKVIKHGEKTCLVEFMFQGMKIIRTRKPTRLIVNDIYEDDAAQNIINEKFGSTFHITGYISQNQRDSFIIMNSNEKIQFLEKYAFNDVNLSEIKERCKNIIKKRKDELNKTLTQIESTNEFIKDLKVPEEIKFPLPGKNRDLLISNEEKRYKNCETRIKKHKRLLNDTQKELNDLEIFLTYSKSKDENIDNLISKLNALSLEDYSNYVGDEMLEEYQNRLINILNRKELIYLENTLQTDKEKLERRKQKELIENAEKINKIENELWKDYSKDETIENINDLKNTLKDARQISFYKTQLQDVDEDNVGLDVELENLVKENNEQKDLHDKLKKQGIVYNCPSCSEKLHFINDSLCISNIVVPDDVDINDVKKKINLLTSKIKSLEQHILSTRNKIEHNKKINKQINDIVEQYEEELNEENLKEDLDVMENYYKYNMRQDKEIIELRKSKFSSNIIDDEKDIISQELHIDQLKEKCGEREDTDNITEDELREMIKIEQNKKDSITRLKNTKNNIEKEKQEQHLQIENKKNEYIAKYKEIRTPEELLEIINTTNSSIIGEENDKEKHFNNLQEIKEYQRYIEDKKVYDKYINTLSELKEKEIEDNKKYVASVLLRDKILESESIAMMNIIDSINTHAQLYLEHFFPENPMTIYLRTFKEDSKKNDKPQINFEIFYKNMECDLNNLSGGEISRVVLAFTLALSDMFNTPILMLDECTASLDQESSEIVFNTIKENFRNKPVLIIAHQVSHGVFDKVINI